MKNIMIHFVFLTLSYLGFSQELTKVNLFKEDSINNVVERYQFIAKDSFGGIDLLLKKSNTYEYVVGTDINRSFSIGTWEKKRNILTLNSLVQKNQIPVRITYDNNGVFEGNSKISVIKNIKGEFVPGFVYVNDDSMKCDPSLNFCNGEFDKINRVKVVLENGLSSEWQAIEKPNEKIVLTVMTDLQLYKFIPMSNAKFKIKKNFLKRKE